MNLPLHVQRLRGTFEKWLYLPSLQTLDVVAATFLANRLSGSRVWLCLVGPSSCGKTTFAESLLGLHNVHQIDQITEGTFASGYRLKEDPGQKFGLFEKLGDGKPHLLLIPDFSAILRQHPHVRGKIFGQLRRVYDGSWSQSYGTGVEFNWKGSVGLIACATPNFEKEISGEAAFGERFLYWKMPPIDPLHVAEKSLRNSERTDEMKKDLRKAMKPLETLPLNGELRLPLGIRNLIAKKAAFVSIARTPVSRDHNHEITDIPRSESPARISQQLGQLLKGLMVLYGVSTVSEYFVELAEVAAYSSIPDSRLRIMGLGEKNFTFTEAKFQTGLPHAICQRTLEDLSEIGILSISKSATGRPIFSPEETFQADFRRVSLVMREMGVLGPRKRKT